MRRLLLPLIPALLTLAGCSTAHHATMRDATSDTVRIVVSRADTVSVAVPVAGKPTRRDSAASWLAGAATGAIAILILLLWRRARR